VSLSSSASAAVVAERLEICSTPQQDSERRKGKCPAKKPRHLPSGCRKHLIQPILKYWQPSRFPARHIRAPGSIATRTGTRLMSGVGLTRHGSCHGTRHGQTHGNYLYSMR